MGDLSTYDSQDAQDNDGDNTDSDEIDVVVDLTPSDDGADDKSSAKDAADTVSKSEFDSFKAKAENDAKELERLRKDKSDLKSALHQARQTKKASKKDEEPPLTDAQLMTILRDNDGDPQTILNVVKYQAKRAASEASKEELSERDLTKKVSEANQLLSQMYPKLADEGSNIRVSVDEAKADLGITDHPLGDYFATGVQLLHNLPGLIEAAEKRGEESASKGTAEQRRKAAIRTGKGGAFRQSTGKRGTLSETADEAATQMGLSPAQRKIMAQISGRKTQTVSVKE